MPDLALNGSTSPIQTPKQEPIDTIEVISDIAADGFRISEPPLKKRRLTTEPTSHKSSPRAPSPPWKNFSADGPTSFVQNGRRKSGRTNAIPLEQQPHSNRRQTRAAYDKTVDKRPAIQYSKKIQAKSEPKVIQATPQPTNVLKRGPGRPPKVKVEGQNVVTPRKMVKAAPQKRGRRSTRLKSPSTPLDNHSEELSDSALSESSSTLSGLPPLVVQKVKFRVALLKPAVTTPANVSLPKKYNTFQEFLEQDPEEPFAGQDLLSPAQIRKEALARHSVHQAQAEGRLKHGSRSGLQLERNTEPRRQFAHYDHLLGHISHFRGLLRQEQRDHRRKAEQIAHEAKKYIEEKRKRGRIKTAEELAQEQLEKNRQLYRGMVKDLTKLWLSVEAEVNTIRLRQYEEEQQARIKGHLNRVLERTDQMLQRHDESDLLTDNDATEEETDPDIELSDSEDVSASESESEVEAEANDPDAGLTAEELKAKYESLPDLNFENQPSQDSNVENDDDESDPETEMDSEFDSDETGTDEDEEDDDENDAESNDGGGLMSLLFSKKQIADMAAIAPPDEQSADEAAESETIEEIPSAMELDAPEEKAESPAPQVPPDNDVESGDPSVQTSPQTSMTKVSETDSTSSLEFQAQQVSADPPREDKSTIRTPVPSLLRGTLREYQHEGLDWLANLYATGRSGILADEMGLGKTIQSIALLAHLAVEYEVWGPHLIVVPTSVMLNWEMEFKKFLPGFKILTYYGTLDERKQKRRGWMADDSFNVCITSYQLVLQDANSFKRRRWHYMILDEAHNIKNFRSERWQTMMTFNTRARLLLTGTPLQNNLTELWSLLFFLHYGQEGQDDDDAFAGLREWSEWFKRPVESILEHGRQVLDDEDKEQVAKLHKVIRPYLLRRLKADVEKQMPAKYEHVEMCRLSKRQRQLYDGFMARAQTKETLASGNYLSIINALMQLRKVCNHPDLFETRPINTSFAMPKSVATDFEIQDLLIRRKLFGTGPLDRIDLDFLQLVPISNEKISVIENLETLRRHAYGPIKALRDSQWSRVNRQAVSDAFDCAGLLHTLDNIGRKARLQDLDRTVYYEAYRHHQRSIYGRALLMKLDVGTTYSNLSDTTKRHKTWSRELPAPLLELVKSIDGRAGLMKPFVENYACLTPAAVAMNLKDALITEVTSADLREQLSPSPDPFHQARMKLSIAFPDKRLLQYDCGKLQRLDKLLRKLQAGGHRALIFTQMTKVLDILEQFLNIHGHRYLRLDGATKIEQRQILTDRFNNDTRILAFILSSRSGGLGINLTGADTVIFYDLDWNPAMDRQCTDRAHRIGQTRDVHIYRFVSEHTIESNILRKANQKQLLDNVVIQEGDFTTDYVNRFTYRDMLDEGAENDMAGAAMDRVLGNDKTAVAAFEQAEDKEDASAAKVAAKEVQNADDGDFEDKVVSTPTDPYAATNAAIASADNEGIKHIDEYLLKLQTFLLKDVPLSHRKDKSKRGRKKDDHKRRKPRK